MTCAGLTAEALSEKSGVPVGSICDAVDYRPELTPDECARLASVLGLNEVGLCALASGKYPLPEPKGLPFQVWPLRMAHGIGVVNAYIIGEDGGRGLLFDTGPGSGALEAVWPGSVSGIDAIFVTHIEAEHAGGLHGAMERFGVSNAFIPSGAEAPRAKPMGGGGDLLGGPAPGHRVQDARTLRDAQLLPCAVGGRPVGADAPCVRRPDLRGVGGRALSLPPAAAGPSTPRARCCSRRHGRGAGARAHDDCGQRAALQPVCGLAAGRRSD